MRWKQTLMALWLLLLFGGCVGNPRVVLSNQSDAGADTTTLADAGNGDSDSAGMDMVSAADHSVVDIVTDSQLPVGDNCGTGLSVTTVIEFKSLAKTIRYESCKAGKATYGKDLTEITFNQGSDGKVSLLLELVSPVFVGSQQLNHFAKNPGVFLLVWLYGVDVPSDQTEFYFVSKGSAVFSEVNLAPQGRVVGTITANMTGQDRPAQNEIVITISFGVTLAVPN